MLKWEIESYDPATGTVAFWVQVPALSHTVDTVIYMTYGNSNISTFQGNQNGTWYSNYAAVYHMSDRAGNPNVADSTVNRNIGTAQANTNTKSTLGVIGRALSFDGTVDYFGAGFGGRFNTLDNITLQAWINVSSLPSSGNWAYVLGRGYNGENESYFLRLETDNNGRSYVEAGTFHFPDTHQLR